jgi:prepilin-type N-terminal cleavage/methylation domain-containing protein/prepilin-type processing-associated H-X9-DG protein
MKTKAFLKVRRGAYWSAGKPGPVVDLARREAPAFSGLALCLRASKRAFTLIELLVVIAIIAILAAILLPVLNHAKQASWRVYCMNNMHQITVGWIMYNSDNNGKFPYNIAGEFGSTNINWAANNESYADDPASTNVILLMSSKNSLLGLYLSDPKVYKCPADQSCMGNTTATPWNGLAGPARVRSYSMSQAVGPNTNGTAVGQGEWLGSLNDNGAVNQPGDWTVYINESMMLGGGAPEGGPSGLIVLVEEHPDSINDGAWAFNMPVLEHTYWIDKPSSLHGDACDFSFADGHCEIYAFKNPGIVPQVTYAQQIGGTSENEPANSDIPWIAAHISAIYH